jgi:hypothetical protein
MLCHRIFFAESAANDSFAATLAVPTRAAFSPGKNGA